MASDDLRHQLQKFLKGRKSYRASEFAQALTLIEKLGAEALSFDELLVSPAPAYRIGITGPPGAGKSTLISAMIKILRGQGKRVGVLAVDPSSPFSHGALLGDRIRFSESFTDPGVFIRSLGSRGSQGGLSALSYLLLRAFDAWEFDVVLLETVGVGQTELEVMYVADYVVVTLVPEGGDAVQAMKAGLLEIADLFVVNKSDRPGSESFAKELKDSLEVTDRSVEVFLTEAVSGKGVVDVLNLAFDKEGIKDRMTLRLSPERLQAEARALLMFEQSRQLSSKVKGIQTPKQLQKFIEK